MTEQERAFEAWWNTVGNHTAFSCEKVSDFVRIAFLAGWKRERAKAKPLVKEGLIEDDGWFRIETIRGFDHQILSWTKANGLPSGTKLRVTVEEV